VAVIGSLKELLKKIKHIYKMIKEILVINGCVSLMLAGLYIGYKAHNIRLALAFIGVGVANLIFMLN